MAFRLVSTTKAVRVSRAMAQKFRDMEPAPGDRNLKPGRLEGHRKSWHMGQFRPATWATCLCRETGETYRVNGKHTSTMVANEEDLSSPPKFYAMIEHYEADKLDDVAVLYSTFDSKDAARSPADINRSFAQSDGRLSGVPAKIFALAAQAIAYHEHGEGYTSKTTAVERASRVKHEADFVEWLNDFLGGESDSTKHFRRGSVVGAMFGTFRQDPSRHSQFWTAVKEETGLSPDLPDRTLARFLATTVISRGAWYTKRAKSNIASGPEFYAKCMACWECWLNGDRITTRKLNATRAAKASSGKQGKSVLLSRHAT